MSTYRNKALTALLRWIAPIMICGWLASGIALGQTAPLAGCVEQGRADYGVPRRMLLGRGRGVQACEGRFESRFRSCGEDIKRAA